MTIPAIINNASSAGSATGAKQAFSIFSEVAARLAIDEGGNLSGNCFVGVDHSRAFDCIKPYLSIVKDCGTGTGCFYNDGSDKPYKYLDGNGYLNLDEGDRRKVILSNGMSIFFYDRVGDCAEDMGEGPINTSCAEIHIDVNGLNGPNTLGRDVFMMEIARTGEVIPTGSFYFNNEKPFYGSDWDQSCNPDASSGRGCLARILREGEINY